jgi:hypothetical protein
MRQLKGYCQSLTNAACAVIELRISSYLISVNVRNRHGKKYNKIKDPHTV